MISNTLTLKNIIKHEKNDTIPLKLRKINYEKYYHNL